MTSRQRAGFTLVELLVVIGVIAILISLLLPALSQVRQAGYKVKCLSNLKQCATAISFYSTAWNGYVLTSTTVSSGYSYPGNSSGDWAGAHKCWPRFYAQGRGMYNEPGAPKYLDSLQVTICPANVNYATNMGEAIKGTLSNAIAYGIYRPTYGELAPRKFKFVSTSYNPGGWWDTSVPVNYPGGTVIAASFYRLNRIDDSTRAIAFADVISSYDPHNQTAEFSGTGTSFNNGAIHLVHNNRANVVFFDGHAESLGAKDLRYGTSTAPDRFYVKDAGPGHWDGNLVFTAPYKNIKFTPFPAAP